MHSASRAAAPKPKNHWNNIQHIHEYTGENTVPCPKRTNKKPADCGYAGLWKVSAVRWATGVYFELGFTHKGFGAARASQNRAVVSPRVSATTGPPEPARTKAIKPKWVPRQNGGACVMRKWPKLCSILCCISLSFGLPLFRPNYVNGANQRLNLRARPPTGSLNPFSIPEETLNNVAAKSLSYLSVPCWVTRTYWRCISKHCE